MTPQLAKDIYYEYFFQAACKQHLDWKKPLIQHECELEAWAAVIDHVKNDSLMELPEVKAAWDAYMEAKHKVRTHPIAAARLYDDFLDKYNKAKDEHNRQS